MCISYSLLKRHSTLTSAIKDPYEGESANYLPSNLFLELEITNCCIILLSIESFLKLLQLNGFIKKRNSNKKGTLRVQKQQARLRSSGDPSHHRTVLDLQQIIALQKSLTN